MWGCVIPFFAYDLPGTGPFGPIECGQYMGGANHLGYYQTGKNLAKSAYPTTQVHGAGVITSSDADINCGATCIHSYPNGSKVKLTATAPTGGRFDQWFGACASSTMRKVYAHLYLRAFLGSLCDVPELCPSQIGLVEASIIRILRSEYNRYTHSADCV